MQSEQPALVCESRDCGVRAIECKGMESCGRKRVVLRADSEHAMSALSKAVCQAWTEESTLQPAWVQQKLQGVW